MRDEMARDLIADAVRRVLEEGMSQASDPADFLHCTVEEIRQVVALCETTHPGEGSALRALLSEQVVAVAQALLTCIQH
ncbi:hypothetical protein [Roseomonas chloroacetimidivorans]|jgi:hypothetical protein|uniref:hypothetical protein n=1 Tax=Roseomonas chloroacetimidivorans TaxID=1766656 RepID=UPI003C725154